MASIVFYQPVNMNAWNFVDDPELTITPTVITASGENGEMATYHGIFIETDGSGNIVNGSIASVAFTIDGVPQYFMNSGFNAVTLFDMLETEDPAILRQWFFANDRLSGSEGADVLHGYKAWDDIDGGGGNDRIYGDSGKDTMDGGLGADRVYGGADADLIFWDPVDLVRDGGTGVDTLRIVDRDLDLRAIPDSGVTGFERILMLAGPCTLTLNRDEVLNLSPSSNVLTVLGDPGDQVDLRGAFTLQSTTGGFQTWRNGAAIVRVDVEVDVV